MTTARCFFNYADANSTRNSYCTFLLLTVKFLRILISPRARLHILRSRVEIVTRSQLSSAREPQLHNNHLFSTITTELVQPRRMLDSVSSAQ